MNQYKEGFSLIEVLIAVVILSFGLLSIATLQIKAKAASYDSIQRSIATQLTQDIIEKMRANPSAAASYVGTFSGGGSEPECAPVSCLTDIKMATFDIYNWRKELASDTGGMEAPIACITALTTANYYNVTITWRGVESINYTGDSTCGGLKKDEMSFRRLITIDVFISKEGLG